MTKEKYAIFDTDFISKSHLIRKDDENKLIDIIMCLPNYNYYCHEQIKIEIGRHDIGESREWLEKMISESKVCCFSDEDILDSLSSIYFNMAPKMYSDMLRNGCQAYKKGYYEENFKRLSTIDYLKISREDFLQELKNDCIEIGEGKNLGELKSYVLLQTLEIVLGEKIYVFCSDDKNARNGIVSLADVRCISILSSFYRLYKDGLLSKSDAEPYIQSFLKFCDNHKQTTFKVHENKKEMSLKKVACEKVLRDIYDDKFVMMNNGNLKYVVE